MSEPITKKLTFDLDGKAVEITAARATLKQGIARYRKMMEECPTDDEDMKYIREFIYPNLASGTIEVTGMEWPMTAEQVAVLPDELVTRWVEIVYDVNPNWEPKAVDPEKKE
jgi:hypothetical protein